MLGSALVVFLLPALQPMPSTLLAVAAMMCRSCWTTPSCTPTAGCHPRQRQRLLWGFQRSR